MLSNDTKAANFSITDTKVYIPVVTLSTQDKATLLEQLKSGFKRTINWNKYQLKVSVQAPSPYLDLLIDTIFQVGNRLKTVASFENKGDRTVQTKYHLPTVEIKDYNVMNDGKNLFDQPVKNNLRTYDNIREISTG